MSLNQVLVKEIGKVLNKYFDLVAKKYNLDKNELRQLWDGEQKKPSRSKGSRPTSNADVDMNDLSPARLHSCTVAELKALCRTHGHKVSGKKQELIDRLLSGPPEEKKKSPAKKGKTLKQSDVVKKLTSEIPTISVRPNSFGNLEHPESNLVFNRKTEKVYGRQKSDGTVIDLTEEDIEVCKKFKFLYELPENLDANDTNDVKVDELDSDSESEIEIEDEESEEEGSEDESEVELEDSD